MFDVQVFTEAEAGGLVKLVLKPMLERARTSLQRIDNLPDQDSQIQRAWHTGHAQGFADALDALCQALNVPVLAGDEVLHVERRASVPELDRAAANQGLFGPKHVRRAS